MKDYISPKELAEAIGVSESSVKRWADQGLIAFHRTGGGHRRIALGEAISFVRRTRSTMARPELLGFAETGRVTWQFLSELELEEMLYQALMQGDRTKAFGIIQGPFLASRPLAWIFDGPVRGALRRIDELWRQQDDGIMLERRATEICVQAIGWLHHLLPLAADAPAAVGCAPAQDFGYISTLMAAAVLRDVGFDDTSLGAHTPLSALLQAVWRMRPLLAWVSVSSEQVASMVQPKLNDLAERVRDHGTELIVIGHAGGMPGASGHPPLTLGDSMTDLASFARGLLNARGRAATDGDQAAPL